MRSDVDQLTRLAMLDLVDADVTTLFAGGDATLPAVAALTTGVREGRVPEIPLRRLVEANRLDQRADRYETFDDLQAYCVLSADPVGHLVLAALGLPPRAGSSCPTASAPHSSLPSTGKTSQKTSPAAASICRKRICAGSG